MDRKRPYLGAFLIIPALEHGLSLRLKLFTSVMNLVSYGIGGKSKAGVWGRLWAGDGAVRRMEWEGEGEGERAWSLRGDFCGPAGTWAFSLFVIWAACAAGGEGAC